MNRNNYNRLTIPATLVFLFQVFAFAPIHKYYFSFTEIRVDTQKATLNVSCKVFTDDLEVALNNAYGKKIALADVKQNKEAQNLLNKYIEDRFKISVTGKVLELEFVGYENEADVTWFYMEVPKFAEKGAVTVQNSILFETFPEQTNVIQFYWDQVNKSHKLVNPEKEVMFEF
ncbi:MAG: DUF6702 family protein [Bacteroidota bacterium]